MAVRTDPVFTKPVAPGAATVSAANTNRDGTGTIVTVVTGVADGLKVVSVRIKATVTTTAGMIRFYYSPDNGATNYLIGEVVVTAITVAANVASFEADFLLPDGGIDLVGTNDLLRASTEKAEQFRLTPRVLSYAA